MQKDETNERSNEETGKRLNLKERIRRSVTIKLPLQLLPPDASAYSSSFHSRPFS